MYIFFVVFICVNLIIIYVQFEHFIAVFLANRSLKGKFSDYLAMRVMDSENQWNTGISFGYYSAQPNQLHGYSYRWPIFHVLIVFSVFCVVIIIGEKLERKKYRITNKDQRDVKLEVLFYN